MNSQGRALIREIREEFKRNAGEKYRESAQRFFKEQVKVHGLETAAVRKIAKERFKVLKERSKTEVFALCEELWRSEYLEEAAIACQWSYALRKRYEPADFALFERWVERYVGNWAACDTLCNHTVGAFLQTFPEYLPQLGRWARSSNRWMRRAAAVSLIVPAKGGDFLSTVFQIADILLTDQDDMVRKGYGWMLKAASREHQREVFDYVMAHKAKMPRTALRYAIEKMPKELKAQAMRK